MNDNRVIELMETTAADRDKDWLMQALQWAIELEFFTIPPYLTAFWSVKDHRDPVAVAIREVLVEEMLHMSLACNMLVAIGGRPRIYDADVVPKYPNRLPGGVKPSLHVALEGLSKQALNTFMKIEEPEEDIAQLEMVDAVETFPRIGAFYDAIKHAFHNIKPKLQLTREGQIETYFGETQQPDGSNVPKNIGTLDDVDAAIGLIKDQGEGTSDSVKDKDTDELAHYYRFKEVAVGRKIIKVGDRWVHQGPEVPMPECWPVGEIPAGGYPFDEVHDDAVWDAMQTFDSVYSQAIKSIDDAWSGSGLKSLHHALELMMSEMPRLAKQIMQVPLEQQPYNYGPNFRFVEVKENT